MSNMYVITYRHGAYSEQVNGNVCLISGEELAIDFVTLLNDVVKAVKDRFPLWRKQWYIDHPAPAKPGPDLKHLKHPYRSPAYKEFLTANAAINLLFEREKDEWMNVKIEESWQHGIAINLNSLDQVVTSIETFDEIKTWIKYNWYDLEFNLEKLKVL